MCVRIVFVILKFCNCESEGLYCDHSESKAALERFLEGGCRANLFGLNQDKSAVSCGLHIFFLVQFYGFNFLFFTICLCCGVLASEL